MYMIEYKTRLTGTSFICVVSWTAALAGANLTSVHNQKNQAKAC